MRINSKTLKAVLIACITLTLCTTAFMVMGAETAKFTIDQFPNILDVKNVPKQAKDWDAFCLADKGAWFGFALPGETDKDYWGSFPGPFVMTEGRWLSAKPAQFFLENPQTGKPLDFSTAVNQRFNYFPGRLNQKFEVGEIDLEQVLIFISSKTAIMRTMLRNTSKNPVTYRCGWKGQLLDHPVILQANADDLGVSLKLSKSETEFNIQSLSFPATAKKMDDTHYSLTVAKEITLQPGKLTVLDLAFTYKMDERENGRTEERKKIQANPDGCFQRNQQRWNKYLNSVLNTESTYVKDPAYRRIAVKALMTLVNNWRCAYGDLKYDGLFPSYAVSYFNGFWAWDSWKHAAAVARFEPELAKDQVRTMFAYQDKFGMVPDVIYSDKKENNRRDSKPPLAAWAVWEIYQQDKNNKNHMAFIKEIFPKLLRYHHWWYLYRDHDKNGLCEYGSTDGTLEAALWESGMDDAVRFDNRKMVKNDDRAQAWSMDVESVDLNAYLYADSLYLEKTASLLGDIKTAGFLAVDAMGLRDKMHKLMFNKETGFYHDIDLNSKAFLNAQGPEGWIPLWAGTATKEQASAVKNVICNPNKFSTYIPFPTVSKDNAKYNTGYWRGAVWLDQAYFGVKGLRNYGFEKEADIFTRQLLDRPEGLKNSDGPIRENYDPETGKGLKVKHFSWSAAHLLMLIN